MKNWIKAILIVSMVSPAFAGVIKEAQAQREVDDAKQALATMEARKELATFLPEQDAYRARIFFTKAQNFLNDSEYDKASFYAILSTNFAKMSIGRGLLAKAERDNLEALASGKALESVVPTLKGAGLKRKGASPVFSGTYDLKALYNIKRAPKVDDVPALSDDMQGRIADMAPILSVQKEVKIQLVAKGKNDELAAKYGASVKDALIVKGIDAGRIEVVTKKGKDSVEVTLDGVKAK
jgi:hypothetical protein